MTMTRTGPRPATCCLLVTVWIACAIPCTKAATFHVTPGGDNADTGLSLREAWHSIDRGQPTWITAPGPAGATELQVANALQFPPTGRVRIGKVVVSYNDRTGNRLLDCKGAPAVKPGNRVFSLDWPAPKPGDVVLVHAGIWRAQYAATGNHKDRPAAFLTVTGSRDKPIVFRGIGNPVIDGLDIAVGLRIMRAEHLLVEGFEVRRGGIYLWQCGNVILRNCRVHHGNRGISIAYSQNIEISGNFIYDLYGAWTGPPLSIGVSAGCVIRNNTIAGSGRMGIDMYGRETDNTSSNTSSNIISHNIITACGAGISVRDGVILPQANVKNNCLWFCGRVQWLNRCGTRAGMNYYRGLPAPPPGNLLADPRIASWDRTSGAFLRVSPDSPCARRGIGAGEPIPYPAANFLPGENRIQNPGFESGWFGWRADSQIAFPPGGAGWQIVDQTPDSGDRCLYILNNPQPGKRCLPAAMSMMFRIDRGKPITISLQARSRSRDKTVPVLAFGFRFPSWQNKTWMVHGVKLTNTWKTYSHTFTIPAYYPHNAGVVLVPGKYGFCRAEFWIDRVRAFQGQPAAKTGTPELILAREIPANLIPPRTPLPLILVNRNQKPGNVQVDWILETPAGKTVDHGRASTMLAPAQRSPLLIPLPAGALGALMFRYTLRFEEKIVRRGHYPWLVGRPAPDGRNRDFWAATPGFWGRPLPRPVLRKRLQAIRALGIGTLHLYLGIDRMQEVHEKAWARECVQLAHDCGMQWLWTLSDSRFLTGKRALIPGPDKQGNGEPIEIRLTSGEDQRITGKQIEAWAVWLKALATRYGNTVKYWEILNEPNCFVSGGEYLRILAPSATALRRTMPGAIIIGGSVVNALRKDLYNKTIFSGHRFFNLFSYHPYRFGLANPESEGESYRRDILYAREDLRKAGSKAGIFLTEEGMGPGWDETRCIGRFMSYSAYAHTYDWREGEILHAQFVARMLATALGEKCQGYNYHVLNTLVKDTNMTPTLALCAIHTMRTILGNAVSLGRINTGPAYVGYMFRDGRDLVAAIWAKDAEWGRSIPVVLKTANPVAIRNLFGNVVHSGTQADRKTEKKLLLGRDLLYLRFVGGGNDCRNLRKLLETAMTGLPTTRKIQTGSRKPRTE